MVLLLVELASTIQRAKGHGSCEMGSSPARRTGSAGSARSPSATLPGDLQERLVAPPIPFGGAAGLGALLGVLDLLLGPVQPVLEVARVERVHREGLVDEHEGVLAGDL